MSGVRNEPSGGQTFSVTILAGGKSSRMGQDKAFLTYKGESFISRVLREALRVSDDVIIAVGTRSLDDFLGFASRTVRVVPDTYLTQNPIGGLLSGFQHVRNAYSAVVACDLPLLRGEVLEALMRKAYGHDAAVPIWENGDTEPLVAVYDVPKTMRLCLRELKVGPFGPRNMLSKLSDVCYVPVEELEQADPALLSFTNVNTSQDYERVQTLETSQRDR